LPLLDVPHPLLPSVPSATPGLPPGRTAGAFRSGRPPGLGSATATRRAC
jgi:hypothetical protein